MISTRRPCTRHWLIVRSIMLAPILRPGCLPSCGIFLLIITAEKLNKTIFDNTPNEYLINQKQATVSNAAESDMRIKEISAAIQGLPEIFRTPFLLYFDGYKYNEIAEVLHEPLGTIKSRIHFARKLLKEQISRLLNHFICRKNQSLLSVADLPVCPRHLLWPKQAGKLLYWKKTIHPGDAPAS